MKIMYSILHAMRAIVCIAHDWENTVLPYKMTTTLFHLYALLFHNVCTVTCGRPMNAPTDTHILLYIIWSGNTDFHFTIHIPDHNFQFSIELRLPIHNYSNTELYQNQNFFFNFASFFSASLYPPLTAFSQAFTASSLLPVFA